MEPKKSPRANLENKRGMFYQIGAVVSLLLMIGVFASSQAEKKPLPPVAPTTIIPEPDLPPVVQDKQPVESSVQPVIINPQEWNIVDNNRDINVIIEWIDTIDIIPELVTPKTETPDTGEEPPFLRVETMPTFQGGDLGDFQRWVQSKISYPAAAADTGTQGRVTISFVIEKDGSLTNIEVLSTPDRSLSDEAVRVLKLSPQWEPGKQRNNPVRVRYNLPVEFRLQ